MTNQKSAVPGSANTNLERIFFRGGFCQNRYKCYFLGKLTVKIMQNIEHDKSKECQVLQIQISRILLICFVFWFKLTLMSNIYKNRYSGCMALYKSKSMLSYIQNQLSLAIKKLPHPGYWGAASVITKR